MALNLISWKNLHWKLSRKCKYRNAGHRNADLQCLDDVEDGVQKKLEICRFVLKIWPYLLIWFKFWWRNDESYPMKLKIRIICHWRNALEGICGLSLDLQIWHNLTLITCGVHYKQ